MFKIAQGIGIGATIDAFISKYSSCKIWYTYVSDTYALETEGIKGLQYFLNKNDLTSEIKVGYNQTLLKKTDFKVITKLVEIRIY